MTRGSLSPEIKHRAQLQGVAAAYFPYADLAFAHTLSTSLRYLDDSENVIAGVPCWRGYRPRMGLLFLTDQSLLWVKQSFFRRRPMSIKLPLAEIAQLRGSQGTKTRRRLEIFSVGAGGGKPLAWFSFDDEEWPALSSFCRMASKTLGDRMITEFEAGLG